MPDAVDPYDAGRVVYVMDHAVVAHTDAPVVFRAGEFPATGWPWVSPQPLNRPDSAVVEVCRKAAQVFLGGPFEEDARHGVWRCVQPGNPRLGGNAVASCEPASTKLRPQHPPHVPTIPGNL